MNVRHNNLRECLLHSTVSTLASYSGGPSLKSRPRDLIAMRFFDFSLGPGMHILEWYLKLGHDRFFLYLSKSLFINHHDIQLRLGY
jgi:hypothetical protein